LSQTSQQKHDQSDSVISNPQNLNSASLDETSKEIPRKKTLSNLMDELPVEIMGEIFILAAEASRMEIVPGRGTMNVFQERLGQVSDERLPRDIHEEDPPIVIPQVCRRWRQVALGTPRLFTWLVFLRGISRGVWPTKVIPRWLQLSGNLPVHIYLDPHRWYMNEYLWTDHNNPLQGEEMQKRQERQVRRLLESISQNLHRCQTFTLLSDIVFIDSLVPVGTRSQAPLMKTFAISPGRPNWRDLDAIAPGAGYGQLIVPNLQRIDAGYSGTTLDFLEHDPRSLRRFSSDGYVTRVQEVVAVLRKYQELEECFLNQLFFCRDKAPSAGPIVLPLITLPLLRSLILTFELAEEGTPELLQALRLQALEVLSIDIRLSRPSRYNTDQLAPAFVNIFTSLSSFPPLKALCIMHLNVPSDDLLGVLRHLDSLETLKIGGQKISPTFVRTLIPTEGEICIIPKLFNFTLDQCTLPGAAVVFLVKERIDWMSRAGDTAFHAYFISSKGFTSIQKDMLKELNDGFHKAQVWDARDGRR